MIVGEEWAIFKLGFPGVIKEICVDTAHFKGNFPDSVKIEGALMNNTECSDSEAIVWHNILKPSKVRTSFNLSELRLYFKMS